jgi:hypothetical protein
VTLLEREIREAVAKLPAEKQKEVLDYALALKNRRKLLTGAEVVDQFGGMWTPEEADEMRRVIEEEFDHAERDVR